MSVASRSERILLTGPDSFTGRKLVGVLKSDGHEVIGFSRRGGGGAVEGDLTDPESIVRAVRDARPTAIIHLAAVTFVPNQDLYSVYAINVAGTASLLKAARELAPALNTVILASTAKVYAPPDEGRPIRESHPLQPGDHYGVSKLAVEQLAHLFARDLPITVLRPFNYTGPGQEPKFFVPKLVEAYAKGKAAEIEVGDLTLKRDFSDVATIIEVYRRLISAPQPGEIFNVCSGSTIELVAISKMLEDITGRQIKLKTNMSLVRADEPRTIVGSSERLDAVFAGLPRPTLRQTLEGMVYDAREG